MYLQRVQKSSGSLDKTRHPTWSSSPALKWCSKTQAYEIEISQQLLRTHQLQAFIPDIAQSLHLVLRLPLSKVVPLTAPPLRILPLEQQMQQGTPARQEK